YPTCQGGSLWRAGSPSSPCPDGSRRSSGGVAGDRAGGPGRGDPGACGLMRLPGDRNRTAVHFTMRPLLATAVGAVLAAVAYLLLAWQVTLAMNALLAPDPPQVLVVEREVVYPAPGEPFEVTAAVASWYGP